MRITYRSNLVTELRLTYLETLGKVSKIVSLSSVTLKLFDWNTFKKGTFYKF